MSGLLLRVVKAEIGSVRSGLRTEIAPLPQAIARLELMVDNLDHDVQALIDRQFGKGTG